MADNQVYRLKADASFPRAIRKVEDLLDGQEIYETEGRSYDRDGYILASDMTPRDRERAANGDLDHLLEKASQKDYDESRAGTDKGVFIAEHEAEAVVLQDYGHQVVPKDQVLELRSAGSDAAKDALAASKEGGRDERPGLTAKEVPALADVSRREARNVPKDSDHVEDSALEGVEMPPGISVGDTKEAAEEAPKPRGRKAKKVESAPAASEQKSE